MKTHTISTLIVSAFTLMAMPLGAQQNASETEQQGMTRAQYEAVVEQAEKTRADAMASAAKAEKSRQAAMESAEAEKSRQAAVESAEAAQEMARKEADASREEVERKQEELKHQKALQLEEASRMREELSRAHRELREASMEVARAHRELSRVEEQEYRVRRINLGDRAVIGVILGPETPQGVKIIGVSPDGPAERAGLRPSDVLTSIAGIDLSRQSGDSPRESIDLVMEDVAEGDEIDVEVIRDDQALAFTVTAEQREPRVWQSLIRIPAVEPAEAVAEVADTTQMIIKHIEVPEIDEMALKAEVAELQERAREMEIVFATSADDFQVHAGEWEFEFEEMSEIGEHALREASVWFGLPQARGLELTAMNPGLGEYFESERGVLVIKASADNAYKLQSGDVVLEIDSTIVDSPTDMMRALRELHSGTEIDITIKRDRRDVTLQVIVPENRIGYNTLMRRD